MAPNIQNVTIWGNRASKG